MTDVLEARFENIQDNSHSDWEDVLRRVSRRGRRRRLATAGAVVLALSLLAPTALALRTTFVDFFQSEPAPQPLVRDFERLDAGAPAALDNHVIYGQARKIFERRIDSGQALTLWVAPNRRGGFCMALVGPRHPGGLGCLWERSPLSPSIEVAGPITSNGVIGGGPVLVWGSVGLEGAETIELQYEDGAVDTQPLTWVSRPIDAAFFLFDVGSSHWQQGHRFDRLVVRDGKGRELRSEPVRFRLPPLAR